jgi:hypothetical protein
MEIDFVWVFVFGIDFGLVWVKVLCELVEF